MMIGFSIIKGRGKFSNLMFSKTSVSQQFTIISVSKKLSSSLPILSFLFTEEGDPSVGLFIFNLQLNYNQLSQTSQTILFHLEICIVHTFENIKDCCKPMFNSGSFFVTWQVKKRKEEKEGTVLTEISKLTSTINISEISRAFALVILVTSPLGLIFYGLCTFSIQAN